MKTIKTLTFTVICLLIFLPNLASAQTAKTNVSNFVATELSDEALKKVDPSAHPILKEIRSLLESSLKIKDANGAEAKAFAKEADRLAEKAVVIYNATCLNSCYTEYEDCRATGFTLVECRGWHMSCVATCVIKAKPKKEKQGPRK